MTAFTRGAVFIATGWFPFASESPQAYPREAVELVASDGPPSPEEPHGHSNPFI